MQDRDYGAEGCDPPNLGMNAPDTGCICEGNWRAIVKETESLIGGRFQDHRGDEFVFFGPVHGGDDYYYGMHGKSGLRLLSCVGSIEGHGFTPMAEGCPGIAQELLAACKDAVLQIEYLQDKFKPTGSGEATLAHLRAAIVKAQS